MKIIKKNLAIFLSLVMTLTALPVMISASAAEASKVLYTMEEDSRPASCYVISRSNVVSYEDSGDLAHGTDLKVLYKNASNQTIQDQSFVMKLPEDVYTAYGTPKSLTFEAKVDTGAVVWNKRIYFASTGTNAIGVFPSATVDGATWSGWSFNGTDWRTYSLDLTTGAGKTAVDNGYLYLNFRNVSGSQNTATYFNIDNVTLNYESSVTQYNVTVDGVATKYDEGAEFSFDKITTDGTNYYMPGEKVTVNSDLTLTTYDLGLAMSQGAAMRLNSVTGLRYYTNINDTAIDALKEAGATLSFGTLIAPKNLLGEADLTLAVADANRLDVKYEASVWYTEDEFSGLVGTISNVKDENVKRDFVGRGYATVTVGGKTVTIYANYYENDEVNNTRQIGWIASEIKAGAEYDGLSAAQKEIVDDYYNLYIA